MPIARIVVAFSIVVATAAPARAEPWYQGRYGKNRVVHVSLTAGAGAAFLTSELLKPHLAPTTCRWCAPPAIDVHVRDAVLWKDPSLAATLSNLSGYVAAPVFALGLTFYDADPSWGSVIDDMVPVLETVALSEVAVQIVKFSVGRARPFVYYDTMPLQPHAADDNVSFFSGHSTLAFGLATSAGVIAHRHHAKLEPLVWAGGFVLAASTAYLRMAADRHYFTDVLAGSAFGVAAGLTVPMLMDRSIEVVPLGNGVAIAGGF